MLKIIRYMFYRIYRLGHSFGRKDVTALIGFLSIILSFNIFTLINLLTILSKATVDLTKFHIGFMTVTLYYFVYRHLGIKERIITIFKEFGKITKQQKRLLNWGVLIYLALTVFLFFYIGEIVREMHRSGVL